MDIAKGIRFALISLIFFTYGHLLEAQAWMDRELDNLSRSVVKVYAMHANEKAASGFIYTSSDLVVTALHVVSGASRIQIKLSNEGALRTANIIRVLKDQDLALLRLTSTSDRTPLFSHNTVLTGGEEVICLGYPFNIPSSDPTFLRVKSSNKRLRDIIPPQIKDQLDQIGFPNTENIILNLDGHLLPGHSGAPIFDSNYRIVAISNGGLAVGGASRSWAIPALHLTNLMTSTELIPNQSVLSRDLYAEELSPHGDGTVLRSEETEDELLFIRNASYAEMSNTTDDPLGLTQITQTFGPIDLFNVTYDIYRERSSGATVVVPGNSTAPFFENDFWMVDGPNDVTQLYFRIDKELSQIDLQNKSVIFEMDLVENDHMQNWMLNSQWSYPFIRPTLSGMSVRRKAFQKWWNGQQTKQMIVTFSTKDDLLLSSAAKFNSQNFLLENNNVNFLWFQFVTSAFLTTLAN